MGRLTAFLYRTFRAWERAAQTAMILALVLLSLCFLMLLFGPSTLRLPVLIGLGGLIIAVQVIFMWANRGMVTPFTQAQRYYLAEDFEGASRVLEATLESGKPDVAVLTLLGNTYRQLGLLDKSEQVLTKALELRPFDHFPLYGFGRTLLIQGSYTSAIDAIHQAIKAGAPSIVQFDLGEAYYRSELNEDARSWLEAASTVDQEPHRALMTRYLLYRLGVGEVPSNELIEIGLPYWKDSAMRYRHTTYGQALADDVQQLQAFTQER